MQRKHFIDRLIAAVTRKQSHVVVGLDPDLNKIPPYLKEEASKRYGSGLKGMAWAIRSFNERIIDSICDIVPAVKPQIAFYEAYGVFGLRAFVDTIVYARKKGLIVIEDAKRNDIGSTAGAYSAGHIGRMRNHRGRLFSVFDVDAITVNPYFGSDGLAPFIADADRYGKGLFILVKTSNPSSCEIQDLEVRGAQGGKRRLFELVGELVASLGSRYLGQRGYSFVGAVVGATYPNEAKILREIMPQSYFLVPGYGAQGGGADDVVPCFNNDGTGALIAASRSIIYAYLDLRDDKGLTDDHSFAALAQAAVLRMTEDINKALRMASPVGT